MFYEKAVLKFCNINTKTPVLNSLFNPFVPNVPFLEKGCIENEWADNIATIVLKKRLQHRGFPVNIANFFKNTFFEEHLRTAASDHCQKDY